MNAPLQSDDSVSLPLGEYACQIGWDWGDSKHDICLSVRGAFSVEELVVANRPEDLHQWLRSLAARFKGQPVAVAIESSKGPVVSLLSSYDWITVYPVHPATSCRFSKAFTPSGAANDRSDARNLLEILQLHRHRLRALLPQDDQTRRLEAFTQLRRKLVDTRTGLCNELASLLKAYFPQALDLIGEDCYSVMAREFLGRWPDLMSLKKAKPQTLRNFYYKHGVRRPEVVEARLEIALRAELLCQDAVLLETSLLRLHYLLAQLSSLTPHIQALEKNIAQAFAKHEDQALFRSLPASGPVMAPRLCALFGTDRDRWHNAAELQKYYGVAPVIEASGKQRWVRWRWNAPTFHRQTLVEWAGLTVRFCPWAKAYYQKQRQRQKLHSSVLRALAFKWLRVLFRCWKNRTPYDDNFYLQKLEAQGSYLPSLVST